jgi:hypothetical protein
MSDVPLPEPVQIGLEEYDWNTFRPALGYTADQMREYAAAVSAADNAALREALTHISLCSQNSMSSKEECGRIARAALEGEA